VAGQHDVVLKRSTNGGISWGNLTVLLDPHVLFGAACANVTSPDHSCEFWDPTPIYDSHLGRVTLMAALSRTKQNRYSGKMSLWSMSSDDLGTTWSPLKNITAQVYDKTWRLGTPSNGHGIQLSSGRLLMPIYVRNEGNVNEMSATFYSDDHGESWHFDPKSVVGVGTSESEIVELFHTPTPTLMFNHRRNRDSQANSTCAKRLCRWQSSSTDGGLSWQSFEAVPQLIDPSCKGGIVGWPERKALLFVNDAALSRNNITLRVSYDDGLSWSDGLLVSIKGGYTDVQLTEVSGKTMVAVIYESDSCAIDVAIVDPAALPPPPPPGAVNASGACTGPPTALALDQCSGWGDFYDTTSGDSWTFCSGMKTDPCACKGMLDAHPVCSEDGTAVERIVLFANNLTGTLPSTIAAFAGIKEFDVSGNALSGGIPASLAAGWASNLTTLHVHANHFGSAPLPPLPFARMSGGCFLLDKSYGGANAFTCPWPAGAVEHCVKRKDDGWEPVTDADCAAAM
jgi:sialidase-1